MILGGEKLTQAEASRRMGYSSHAVNEKLRKMSVPENIIPVIVVNGTNAKGKDWGVIFG